MNDCVSTGEILNFLWCAVKVIAKVWFILLVVAFLVLALTSLIGA